jgi:hypothetical protein
MIIPCQKDMTGDLQSVVEELIHEATTQAVHDNYWPEGIVWPEDIVHQSVWVAGRLSMLIDWAIVCVPGKASCGSDDDCPYQKTARWAAVYAMRLLLGTSGATPEIVARSVAREVARAQELHPDWPADPVYQAAIVGEEAGELLRAALVCEYRRRKLLQRQPGSHATGEFCPVKREAIHVAATAVRVLIEWPETQEEGD